MRSRRVLLCFHCAMPVTADEREHYGYACHLCVMREHDLALLATRDPDHPEVETRPEPPVTLGETVVTPPERTVRRRPVSRSP